jgi:RNase H-like domain found in reverse transcriptase
MVAKETLLRYPDPNKPFLIDTDASDYQLGAVIKQEGLPLAFYSRKLTKSQRKYTTIEKELLSILEVLEHYRSFLWGRQIKIRTDHRNLAYTAIKSQRVLNWRLLVEDFKPELEYYPGEKNIEADTLSRHPIIETMAEAEVSDALLNYPDTVNQYPATMQRIR